jgi:hypothetical protein
MSNKSAKSTPKNHVTCDQVETQLVRFVKGSLSQSEQQRFAVHLASCDRCSLSLQELRTLESELRVEASQYHPELSAAASQRIQQQVYRRMRFSLVWQRLFQSVKMGGALVGATAVLIIALLFGYQWLQFMANIDDSEVIPGASVSLPVAANSPTPTLAEPTAVPTPLRTPYTANSEHIPWENLVSVTSGETPTHIARTIIEAALANDASQLGALFAAMPIYRDPTIRLWLLFNRRCHDTVTAADFTYEQLPTGDLPITAVYLHHQNRYTGEIKFREIYGEWYAVFTHPPSINACLQARLILPES